MSPVDWHARFQQQASWTAQLRAYLLPKLALQSTSRILEVGCGSGAVLKDMQERTSASLWGLDRAAARLRQASRFIPRAHLSAGQACHLPYAAQSFDLTYSHFLLLWLENPLQALQEMRRVTRPGGHVLALAEPDYSARIDHPAIYRELGAAQRSALIEQGAHPDIGRRLPELFTQAHLTLLESGILGAQWAPPPDRKAWRSEWEVLRADLSGRISAQTLNALQKQDWQDRLSGRRVLFVPVFYAWARV